MYASIASIIRCDLLVEEQLCRRSVCGKVGKTAAGERFLA